MNGFKLNMLIATGKGVPSASVEFKEGLNMIIGPSDTGKTYIYEAIDYMLGGRNLPKSIQEAEKYSDMFLEIEEYNNGDSHTIYRSLVNKNEDIIVYNSKYEGIEKAEKLLLHYQHKQNRYNISEYLLEMSNFSTPIQVRVNQNYKKDPFTFRSYLPYSMVSENKMTAENSPIYHNPNYNDRTKYLYQFKFMITNSDDSKMEEKPAEKIFNASKEASVTLLKDLVTKEKENHESIQRKINALSSVESNDLTETLLGNIQEDINELNNYLLSNQKEKNELISGIDYNKSILKRFTLLKQQYESDIDRLKFIDEGSFLINQLNINSCPHCGKELGELHDSCDKIDLSEVSASCEYEITQIKLKLLELEKSIYTTFEVIDNKNIELAKINTLISGYKEEKEQKLYPELHTLKTKLKQYTILNDYKIELENSKSKIKQYTDLLTENTNKKNKKYSSPVGYGLDIIKDSYFKNELSKVLKAFYFNYNDELDIGFYINKNQEVDFTLNDRERISFGKGSRSILASAFYISIRNYCYNYNYPHANFLVLDSPINAFKETESKERLDNSIKNKFIKYLAYESLNSQTIIMENLYDSDLLREVKDKVHIIEFTKTDKGRYGFY